MVRDYADIMDEDTRIREAAAAKASTEAGEQHDALLEALVFIALGLGIAFWVWRKSKQPDANL